MNVRLKRLRRAAALAALGVLAGFLPAAGSAQGGAASPSPPPTATAPAGTPAAPARSVDELLDLAHTASSTKPPNWDEAQKWYLAAAEAARRLRAPQGGPQAEALALIGAGRAAIAVNQAEAAAEHLHRALRADPSLVSTADVAFLRIQLGEAWLRLPQQAALTGKKVPSRLWRRSLSLSRREFETVLRDRPRGRYADFAQYDLASSYEIQGGSAGLTRAIEEYLYVCGGAVGVHLRERLELEHASRSSAPMADDERRGFIRPRWPWSRLRAGAHFHIAFCLLLRSRDPRSNSADREEALRRIEYARTELAGGQPVQDTKLLDPEPNEAERRIKAERKINQIEAEVQRVEVEHLYQRALFYRRIGQPRAVLMLLAIIEHRFAPARLAQRLAELFPERAAAWTLPQQLRALREAMEKKLRAKASADLVGAAAAPAAPVAPLRLDAPLVAPDAGAAGR